MKIQSKKSKKIPLIIGVVVAVFICGGYFALRALDTTSSKVTRTSSGSIVKSDTNVPGSINNPDKNSNGNSGISSSKDGVKSPSIDPSVTPKIPSGTFVSNHRPNLSGSPTPNTGSSNCITTPGAKCMVRFTKGSVVKSLESKVTNDQGACEWEWSLQGIGLEEGTWKVAAIATNGTLTSQTQDSIDMVVSL